MIRALLVYPTHENCEEQLHSYLERGLSAAVYPGRFTEDTHTAAANCWNEDADAAERMGLSVRKSVCESCQHQSRCWKHGYLNQLIRAKEADVALCTHKRAEYGGFADLTDGRSYISIHENPISLLRPACASTLADLRSLGRLMNDLLNNPRQLDWFGSGMTTNSEGEASHSLSEKEVRDFQYQCCLAIADLVDDLISQTEKATSTTVLTEGTTFWPELPPGLEKTLFKGTRRMKLRFDGQPWRFVLNALQGRLINSAILVSNRDPIRRRQGEIAEEDRSVLGFLNNVPPPDRTVWFADATLTHDCLSAVLRREVVDSTPAGRISFRRKAIQYVQDISRQTRASVVTGMIRGFLVEHSSYRRVGIIGHRGHSSGFLQLGPGFAHRVVRTSYFGKGDDRSSNDWWKECDLIIIAGTPRIPPDAVSSYLLQVRNVVAATRKPEWRKMPWVGVTDTGERTTVSGSGYDDPDWRGACRDLVRAALVQAIGRGRGILEDGCDVVVFSTEECGLTIATKPLEPLSDTEVNILSVFSRLSLKKSSIYILDKMSVSTSEIATDVHLPESTVRRHLNVLEKRGLVHRTGERGGWSLSAGLDFFPGP